MSIFGRFRRSETESVVLIDVSSASVAGAYAYFKRGELPTILYTKRSHIRPHGEKVTIEDMERTLRTLAEALVKEGAPALARHTGSGAIAQILVTVGAPWQDTRVHTEMLREDTPFTFTPELAKAALRRAARVGEGSVLMEESIVAVSLDGREVANPFGTTANRADIVALSSTLDAEAAGAVMRTLREVYHTHAIRLTAFAPVAYAILRDLYPHEKDYLVLDVTAETTDLLFVRRGLLDGVGSTPHGFSDIARTIDLVEMSADRTEAVKAQWLDGISEGLMRLAEGQPLPHTLFFLAPRKQIDVLRSTLLASSFLKLWPPAEPPTIIPLLPEHLAPYVHTRAEAYGDTVLAMLALFQNKRTRSA